MAKKPTYQIPFDEEGNQHDYEYSGHVMTDNFTFHDTLTLDTYGRGRSSVSFYFTRSNGKTVSFFVSNFMEVAHKMVEGKITGNFTFVKKGQNYGCKLLEDVK